jgi:hypothetical protein
MSIETGEDRLADSMHAHKSISCRIQSQLICPPGFLYVGSDGAAREEQRKLGVSPIWRYGLPTASPVIAKHVVTVTCLCIHATCVFHFLSVRAPLTFFCSRGQSW